MQLDLHSAQFVPQVKSLPFSSRSRLPPPTQTEEEGSAGQDPTGLGLPGFKCPILCTILEVAEDKWRAVPWHGINIPPTFTDPRLARPQVRQSGAGYNRIAGGSD